MSLFLLLFCVACSQGRRGSGIRIERRFLGTGGRRSVYLEGTTTAAQKCRNPRIASSFRAWRRPGTLGVCRALSEGEDHSVSTATAGTLRPRSAIRGIRYCINFYRFYILLFLPFLPTAAAAAAIVVFELLRAKLLRI